MQSFISSLYEQVAIRYIYEFIPCEYLLMMFVNKVNKLPVAVFLVLSNPLMYMKYCCVGGAA